MNSTLSPRRRRLRITTAVLLGVGVISVIVGVLTYFRRRPAEYRPDEASADITSELARSLPPDAPRPRLTEVTRAAGLAEFSNFSGTRTSEMPEDLGPGLAWGDFDNDGDEDLFLVSAGGGMDLPEAQLQPCVLYENLGNGRFRRAEGFPELRLHGNGAAWGDYDGDGFLDLVVSGYQSLLLFHNEAAPNGGRIFVRNERFPNPPGFWTGVAWGDFDNDRALDLYVCGYIDYLVSAEDRSKTSAQIGTMVPFTLNPASFKPGSNLLLHNNRDGTFTDQASVLGVTNPEGRSLGAVWHDFDGDGWLDLYVANDISDNVFYHNLGRRFEDISHPALVADYRSAMGLAVGDYDRDGDDDLFVTHWVAQENALYDNTWMDFNHPRSSASTAASSTNRFPLRFMDIADRKGLGQIALPYVGWGTEFVDLDGDGWLDLLAANGSTLEEEGPSPRKLKPQETFLFWNRRGEYFHNLAPLHPGLSAPHNSRGLAVADFDNDGAMDFVIADLGQGVRLFRNEMQTGHWIKIRLRSQAFQGRAAGFGEGSTLIAHAGEVAWRRSVNSVSYLSQSSHTLHVGLGAVARLDRLEVRWHAGGTNVFEKVDADAFYEAVEGESTLRKLSGSGSLNPVASSPGANAAGSAAPATPAVAGARAVVEPSSDRERLRLFWQKQRAAMDAMKVDKNQERAVILFREALALNSTHEDSLYYLASCLAATGDREGALEQLARLKEANPHSQRGFAQWGIVRAISARNPEDLRAAEESLLRAQAINPEETGALLVLGEVALLRGDASTAEERLAAACRTNPKAVGGFFLRAYLAWRRGDRTSAQQLLEQTRSALGPDWKPEGTTSEGDVKQKQHREKTPLGRFWEEWSGRAEPEATFSPLEAFLRQRAIR